MDTEIIASILGGLVSGLFTFIGVFLTICYQRKKDKKEDKRIKENLEKEEFKDRPRLEIVDFYHESTFKEEENVDVGMLVCCIRKFKNIERAMFFYDEEITQKEKWVYAEYVLKNTGNTEINEICFSTNLPKNTSMFNTTTNENVLCYNNNFLNYKVFLNKNVKPGQIIKIRVYFVSDKIVYSSFGNPLISIWLSDVNKNIWIQDLDAPNNKLYNSRRTTKQNFYAYTSEDKAIECFIDPMKW